MALLLEGNDGNNKGGHPRTSGKPLPAAASIVVFCYATTHPVAPFAQKRRPAGAAGRQGGGTTIPRMPSASCIAVIDFETTGMVPAQGARATEVAIVLVDREGRTVDRFQSLMKTGAWLPPFIVQLTGITPAMLETAPPADAVMREAARFVGDAPMVAHNAAFDSRFWQAELALAGQPAPHAFACTVLLSRRLYPKAPSHQLGRIVDHLGLPRAARAHRALADAEMAAALLGRIQHDLRTRHGIADPGHDLLGALQRCARKGMDQWLARHAMAQRPLPGLATAESPSAP